MNTSSQTPDPSRRDATQHAIVIGAGLAGATTARALAERHWQVTVLDPQGIATGASGNLAGVVYSTPSPHLTAQNRFYQSSYCHALGWLHRYGFPGSEKDGQLNGVIQHFVNDKQRLKLTAAMDSKAWPNDLLRPAKTADGVELVGGGYLRPDRWCQHLLNHPAITVRREAVTSLHEGKPARVQLGGGGQREADAIIVCTAGASQQLPGLAWLPLKHIRGQVSYCQATDASRRWQQAQCHGGYLTPAMDNLHCVGATFNLHEKHSHPTDADDADNLAQLKHYLPEAWQALGGDNIVVKDRRVAFRCQSLDFVPLCGPLPVASENPHRAATGLYLNLAHGSRGITGTPLCVDLLADLITGQALSIDAQLVDALDPSRFIVRKRKKQPEWKP